MALRQEESRRPELKVLAEVLDDESVLGPDQIKLALWLRERYFCTLYDAVKLCCLRGCGTGFGRCSPWPWTGRRPWTAAKMIGRVGFWRLWRPTEAPRSWRR